MYFNSAIICEILSKLQKTVVEMIVTEDFFTLLKEKKNKQLNHPEKKRELGYQRSY